MGKLQGTETLKPVGFDEETYANEAYESMTLKKQMYLVFVCYLIYFLFALICFILPSQNYEETRKVEIDTNTTTKMSFDIIDSQEKIYQPYIRLFLDNKNKKLNNQQTVTLCAEGSVNLFKGINLASKYEKQKTKYEIQPQESIKIFELIDAEASKVDIKGELNLISGSTENIQLRFQKFNSGYGFFIFFLFIILSIILCIAAFKLIESFRAMKTRVPTSANRYLLLICLCVIIATVPIPELTFFDILYPARLSAPYLTALYKAFFVACALTLCWNLVFRDDEKELLLYRLSYIYTPLLFFIFQLPSFVSIEYELFNKYILFFIILLIISLIIIPFLVDIKSEEFNGSITHLLIVLPCFVFLCIGFFNNYDRYNRFEVFTRMSIPISILFLSFIRWPFEDLIIEIEDNNEFIPDNNEKETNNIDA